MWAIYNKNNVRMYQYPCYSYEDAALSALTNLRERYPDAGLHLKRI